MFDKIIYIRTKRFINKQKISEKKKKEVLKNFEKIINEKNIEKRYLLAHNFICDYLDDEFYGKNLCGFKNNICSRRQDMIDKGIIRDTYENGCCHGYKEGRDCEKLKDGRCTTRNIACKLFVCPYLRKKGVHFSLNKIPYARYLFNKRQKLYIITNHFIDQEIIVKGLVKRRYGL